VAAADRAFWSAYAVVYDAIWDGPFTRSVIDRVVSELPDEGEIVDLGCGTGLVGRAAIRAGRTVIGVDAVPAMLRRALRRERVSCAVEADAADTGLETGCAAGVTIVNVLHVHPDPAAVLAEAVRIAAPGAPIVIATPDAGVTHERLAAADRALGRSWPGILAADALRRVIGVLGTASGLAARGRPDLHELVAHAPDCEPVTAEHLRGCQQLAVLRAGRAAPSHPKSR
jgi:SAM-dependent methyltransferase